MIRSTLLLLLVAAKPLFVQQVGPAPVVAKKEWSLSLYAVLRMRTTPMNVFNFRPIRYDVFMPYNREANLQQPSVGIRPALQVGRWTLSYAPFLHYGPIHHRTPPPAVPVGIGYTPQEQKKLLLDQELQVAFTLGTTRKMVPRHLRIGYGVLNAGEQFYLRNGPYDGVIDLRIKSIVGGVGFEPFGARFPLWVGVNYLYQGLPNNRVDNFLCYTLSSEFRLVKFTR